MHKSRVTVTRGDNGYENTLEALKRFAPDLPAGGRILIKPNAGRMVDPDTGVNTSPAAVAAVLDYVSRQTAAELIVGESPICGVRALESLEQCGIAEEARKRNIAVVDLDSESPVTVKIPGAETLNSFKICGLAHAADFIISVPVMKTHMHTVVSLSYKNMKGILYKKEKVRFHQLTNLESSRGDVKPLDLALAEAGEKLRPDLSVIDGSTGLEGFGPGSGTPIQSRLCVVGENPVSADAVATRLMGIDPARVPHLVLADQLGFGNADLKEIHIDPREYRDWEVRFQMPPEKIDINYPGIMVHDRQSCSACLSTLALLLERYNQLISEYGTKESPIHIAIGKDVGDAPPGTVFIGNCTRKCAAEGLFIKGCPPVSSYIIEQIQKNLNIDRG